YAITRTTRYPANCPAPCPAGALVVGPSLTLASLTVPLIPFNTLFAERVNTLDIKIAKAFKVQGGTLEPAIEMFNVNNSDAINAYRSVSYATATYRVPSTITQGRIIGIALNARW